jgi:hypothetical protein
MYLQVATQQLRLAVWTSRRILTFLYTMCVHKHLPFRFAATRTFLFVVRGV